MTPVAADFPIRSSFFCLQISKSLRRLTLVKQIWLSLVQNGYLRHALETAMIFPIIPAHRSREACGGEAFGSERPATSS
jgi:hypothetical protein